MAAAACSGGGGGPAPSPTPVHGTTVAIQVGVNPAGIAVGDGFAWVANSGEGTVSKIALGTDKQVARIPVGDPKGLAGCETGSIHQTPH
ncbi:MAG TPA: hypothetical protein VOB72_20930, partial [Candidatus Dormibacteraeota bacterium]|nr:hypothetical protein [Candidatus Dormibacteraeota bacterium]